MYMYIYIYGEHVCKPFFQSMTMARDINTSMVLVSKFLMSKPKWDIVSASFAANKKSYHLEVS